MYAHTQTFHPRDPSRSIVRLRSYLSGPKTHLYFHYALGGTLRALAHMLDSLVRVSRRDDKRHFVHVFPYSWQNIHSTQLYSLFPRDEKRGTWKIYKYILTHCLPSVPFQQFQVLFHSLFKVLFIFPSRYLFAIGLPPIFSFRWNLPPN